MFLTIMVDIATEADRMALALKKTPDLEKEHWESLPENESCFLVMRSWLSVFPSLVGFVIVAILSVYISRNYPVSILVFDFTLFGETYRGHMPLMGLLLAISLARPMFYMYDCRYEIRTHHVRAVEGLLSLSKREIAVPYEDMRGIEVEQGILDRIFGIGKIVLGTAMTDKPEVVMDGVGNPHHYGAIISERIDEHRKRQFLPDRRI